MSPADSQRLRTPRGTESFFMEEAYRHRQLVRMTEDHFSSWGYLPVLTPVFDYFETYRPLLSRNQVERSYRFPDRGGELLMLRSDITLFLAKQMGLDLDSAPLPRRVYYADSIIRHQEEEDISSDEFFQSGAELIGLEGMSGDLEVLMLLHDLLEAMRIPRWRMHIGSRSVLDAVLAGRVDASRAGDLLEIRDIPRLERMMTDAGLPASPERARLMAFLGTPEEFAAEGASLAAACEASDGADGADGADGRISRAVADLAALSSELAVTASMDNIRIDLSEHGGQPYYSGFTVRAYADGASTAIASGGRYDHLLGSFGRGAPAAGFSMMMRKIEPLSLYAADAAGEKPVGTAAGDGFAGRYADARERRENGERVAMTESGGTEG